ncbi:MAG: hypothetical protein RLZZ04_806 [Cyanobacteriota bacterium]
MNYQNLAVKLTAVLAIVMAIALINLAWVFPAVAATQKVQIKSLEGYQVEINFSYDEAQNTPILSEQGREAKLVDDLKVNFYNPDGKMIASYDNIVHGIIQSKYFEFNYALETQRLQGKLDLGGTAAGEIYLKGDIDQGLSLIMVEPSGEERVVDRVK